MPRKQLTTLIATALVVIFFGSPSASKEIKSEKLSYYYALVFGDVYEANTQTNSTRKLFKVEGTPSTSPFRPSAIAICPGGRLYVLGQGRGGKHQIREHRINSGALVRTLTDDPSLSGAKALTCDVDGTLWAQLASSDGARIGTINQRTGLVKLNPTFTSRFTYISTISIIKQRDRIYIYTQINTWEVDAKTGRLIKRLKRNVGDNIMFSIGGKLYGYDFFNGQLNKFSADGWRRTPLVRDVMFNGTAATVVAAGQ